MDDDKLKHIDDGLSRLPETQARVGHMPTLAEARGVLDDLVPMVEAIANRAEADFEYLKKIKRVLDSDDTPLPAETVVKVALFLVAARNNQDMAEGHTLALDSHVVFICDLLGIERPGS